MATSAMSSGTGDRMENEHDHLEAVKILEKVRSDDESSDGHEIVATEK